MNKAVCPYLCAPDANNQPQPPLDYPSFENQCRAASDELLLLADQATFCLSGEQRACPRFAEMASVTARDLDPPRRQRAVAPLDSADELFSDEFTAFVPAVKPLLQPEQPDNRRWAWLGAALIFATVLLCGGSWAAYVGWQMVNERVLTARPNRIETLAQPTAPAAAFLVMTATSAVTPEPPTPTPTTLVITPEPPLAQANYPAAVTPTPIVVQVGVGQAPAAAAQDLAIAAPLTDTSSISTEPLPNIELPTPELNLQSDIPTRRPTPIIDLPTSTPTPENPTPTPTPTVVLGTPVVLFAPLKAALEKDQCTLLRWHVENVRAVYYENQGVNGTGEDEECITDKSAVYSLSVVLGDGSTKTYTTTITYLAPTATPIPTPTFTPEITAQATPTWTPPDTPTPDVDYGVMLQIIGDRERTCAPDSKCEFELLVTNLGTARDNLAVNFTATGPWATLLCTDGGNNCSTSSLKVPDVEPGIGKKVTLQVTVPADAAGQSASYRLQAASLGAGGAITSGEEIVEAKTP